MWVNYLVHCRVSQEKQNSYIGLIQLRIESSGGLLWTQQWIFTFHKMRWISWIGERLLVTRSDEWTVEYRNAVAYLAGSAVGDRHQRDKKRGLKSSCNLEDEFQRNGGIREAVMATRHTSWQLRAYFGYFRISLFRQPNIMKGADGGHSRRDRKRDSRINSRHAKTTGMRVSAVKTERAVSLGDARNKQDS
jgi:hypothetical protein